MTYVESSSKKLEQDEKANIVQMAAAIKYIRFISFGLFGRIGCLVCAPTTFFLYLEVYLYTSNDAAALTEASCVNTLPYDRRCAGELGVRAEVLGDGEEVVALYPELQSLKEGRVHRQFVAEGDALQAEI